MSINLRQFRSKQGFTPRNPAKIPEVKNQSSPAVAVSSSPNISQKSEEMICSELEATIELFEILTTIPDQAKSEEELINLLSDQGSYQDKINYQEHGQRINFVSLNKRTKGKNLLQSISPEFKDKLLKNKTSTETFNFLEKQLEQVGLSVDTIDYRPPLNIDTRHIIRMEFNGSVYEPDEDHLSDAYFEHKKNPPELTVSKDSYNLDDCPSWAMFKQFANFKNMENEFRQALAWSKVPPQMLKDLNSFDFEDLLFRHQKETDFYGKEKNSYRLFEGAREAAVKIHTHNHKAELITYFKELGAKEEDIQKLLDTMENKGRIPPLPLPNGDYLTATVHHDDAILDTDPSLDITQTNAAQNFRIIFRKNAKDDEQINFAIQKENRRTNFFKEKKLAVEQDIDLNALASSADKRKEFIQKIALDKFKELYVLFVEMGLKDPKQAVATMMQAGEFPQLDLPNNQIIGLDIKRSKRGINLVFQSKEKPSHYADIHANIFHGLRTSPVYMSLNQDGTQAKTSAIALDSEHYEAPNKQAYALENSSSVLQKLTRKVMFRIHTHFSAQNASEKDKKDGYIAFVLGGLKKNRMIFANKDDLTMVQNRHNELQQGNKYYDSRKEFKRDR